jgi:DNA (cytosine-5)-methyltransferase 1
VGGLSYGLNKANVSVVAGFDLDASCKFPFEANNDGRFFSEDVEALPGAQLLSIWGKSKIRLLAGCSPCQPFSTYSHNKNKKDWRLLDSFTRLVMECEPELVTMENVPGLAKAAVYKRFISTLDSLGYHITEIKRLNCVEYGIPQQRKRLVVLASRFGTVAFPKPTNNKDSYRTVRQTIGHLESLSAGEASARDPLHIAAGLSEVNMRRIKASKPGGTWRDWPRELVADCHRRSSGSTYAGVYGRMEWDKPSPTITTQAHGYGNGRFGHPRQCRAISLREAAMLQTFPQKYKFVGRGEQVNFTRLTRFIGNAVPVRLGEVIGRALMRHVEALD